MPSSDPIPPWAPDARRAFPQGPILDGVATMAFPDLGDVVGGIQLQAQKSKVESLSSQLAGVGDDPYMSISDSMPLSYLQLAGASS